VAYMKGQVGALISLLARKRIVLGWTYYVFVLVPNNRKIYQYRTELVRCGKTFPGALENLQKKSIFFSKCWYSIKYVGIFFFFSKYHSVHFFLLFSIFFLIASF